MDCDDFHRPKSVKIHFQTKQQLFEMSVLSDCFLQIGETQSL